MTFLLLFVLYNVLLRMTASYNLEISNPILYEMPADIEKGSYFGMSVAIRPKAASLNNTWTIQIGAPRGGVAGNPGKVHRCHTFGPCRVFEPDKDMNTFGGFGIYEYKEKKDGAWIGVAMDVKNLGFLERSVVCGHRWMNQNLKNSENIDVTYLMTGVCYLQDLNGTFETPVRRLLPLVNKGTPGPTTLEEKHKEGKVLGISDLMFAEGMLTHNQRCTKIEDKPRRPELKFIGIFYARVAFRYCAYDKIYSPKPYVADLSTYNWGLGQAGFSVILSEQHSNLLMGAPGVTHWIGSVIRYEKDLDAVVGDFVRSEVAKKSRYAYLGYSVAFGRFYKDREIWYVAGAPRSGNYRGQVFTFQFKGPFGDVRIQSDILGATFGEYFGSSLIAGDLNNDGYDDLVVGAPLFSSKNPDEGRVYVYLGTGRGNFLEPAQVINGRIDKGQFGLSITFLKDLDQDGYNDIAVGAPYENNKRGAVYIYKGFFNGLQTEYSQRICAHDIHPHLRGFGVSLSPPVDIDGNKFLDLAIGAYLSGHVVLLRSRPIISLYPYIKTDNLNLIDRNDSYFNVTVCSKYTGSNAPNYVDIVSTLEIDPVYGRGVLSSKISSARKIVRLRLNQIVCEIHPVMLNFSRNFSPLQVVFKNEIHSCKNNKRSLLLIKGQESEGADEFQKTCPVGNKAEISREIPFADICGPDFLCLSDLELLCDMPAVGDVSFTLGSTETIVLAIKVKNLGEPAYQTKIQIQSNLKLKHFGKKKGLIVSKTHWLNVEGFLADSYQTNFSFQIDYDALKEAKKETRLNLMLKIFTASAETNLKNNHCQYSVKLASDTMIHFYASSSMPNGYITKAMLQSKTIKVTHYYEVQKAGVTPLKDAQLTIYIPYFYKKEILTFEIVTTEWMYFSDLYEKKTPEENEKGDSEGQKRKDDRSITNRILFLNCSTAKNKCKTHKIFFTKGIPKGFSFYVKILFSINISAIDSIKDKKDIIQLSTTGVLKYSKFLDENSKELQKSATTILYNEEREFHVNANVVLLSVLAGGLLLSLITTVLAKRDFFKRNKKQELRALREADAIQQEEQRR